MIVFDKNGQYTDLFNAYDSDVLMPEIKKMVKNAVVFLDENGAEPIDYRLLEQVVMDSVQLATQSAWMERIERLEVERQGDE